VRAGGGYATGHNQETNERCSVDRHDLCPFNAKSDGEGSRHQAAARCFCWCHGRDLEEVKARLGVALRRMRIDAGVDEVR